MTELKHGTWFPGISEGMWGWQKRVLESGIGWKLISKSLWALQDVTLIDSKGPQPTLPSSQINVLSLPAALFYIGLHPFVCHHSLILFRVSDRCIKE